MLCPDEGFPVFPKVRLEHLLNGENSFIGLDATADAWSITEQPGRESGPSVSKERVQQVVASAGE